MDLKSIKQRVASILQDGVGYWAWVGHDTVGDAGMELEPAEDYVICLPCSHCADVGG
jgi:hypothetical protein